MRKSRLLIEILCNPSAAGHFTPPDWDLLLRQARSANLVAHLGVLLEQQSEGVEIPQRVHRHLAAARLTVKRQNMAVRWEISQLQQALYSLSVPILALKGTAYVLADLPNGHGRLFSDIDILVPRAALNEVEIRLRRYGWRSTHNNAYDQRYYRQWMHELPPLQHIRRQTVLDVHHSILPLTARIHPDPRRLIENAVADPASEDLFWLAPADMVLHSITHLFHDGELENGLRDLVDIKLLLEHFATEAAFWHRLVERARVLELTRPLYYGLRYVQQVLQLPVPAQTVKSISAGGPNPLLGKMMDLLFETALQPSHATCDSIWTASARWMLYIRAHALRMPFRLLIPHLMRKALVKRQEVEIKIPEELKKIVADVER